MAEVKIIYWSGTGNTAAMAQSVADGVAAAGAEMIEAEGIIANEAPDADAQAACEAAGKELAANA